VKRFTKLERARANEADEAQPPPANKRFEAIEAPRGAAPQTANPFAPPPLDETPVQLELHDRYSAHVDEARRTRQAQATEQLTRLEAEAAAREVPHRAPGVLDLAARGAGVGPLARLGAETRLWIVGGVLLATWFAVGLTLGGAAAVVVVGLLLATLLALGAARRSH